MKKSPNSSEFGLFKVKAALASRLPDIPINHLSAVAYGFLPPLAHR